MKKLTVTFSYLTVSLAKENTAEMPAAKKIEIEEFKKEFIGVDSEDVHRKFQNFLNDWTEVGYIKLDEKPGEYILYNNLRSVVYREEDYTKK